MNNNQEKRIQSPISIPIGDHLFDEELYLTGVTEYGISFEDLMSGRTSLPPQGARFDVAYEGAIEGARLRGHIRGVDYVRVRADGRFELNIYASLTTDDGVSIAVSSGGRLIEPDPETGIAQLRLNMEFATASADYSWVNKIQAWGTGSVNLVSREITMRIYEA